MDFATRLPAAAHAELERLARKELPVAEIWRRVGATAEAAGRPRPSYECVRALVAEVRARPAEPTWGDTLYDIATTPYQRSPEEMVARFAGHHRQDRRRRS